MVSSTLQDKLRMCKNFLKDAYNTIVSKGGTLPVEQDMVHLNDAIESIPTNPFETLSQLGFTQQEIDEINNVETPTQEDINSAIPCIGLSGSGYRAFTFGPYSNLRYIPTYTVTNTKVQQLFFNFSGLCEVFGGIVQKDGFAFTGSGLQLLCGNLPRLKYWAGDILDFTGVTGLREAFAYSYALERLPKIKVSNVLHGTDDMWRTFCNCYSLKSIDFADSDFSGVTTFRETFSGCLSLREIKGVIDLSGNTSTLISSTFANCRNLVYVRIKNLGQNLNLSTCTSLNYDSLLYLVQNLQNVSGKTLTLGAANLSKLTATKEGRDAIDYAVSTLGWTIAQ